MQIAILKSAYREAYLAQNLKLLRMTEGEEMALRYRAQWVHPDLHGRDDMCGSQGTLIFCDAPAFQPVSARSLTVFNYQWMDTSCVIYVRAGAYVDPDEATDWTAAFRDGCPQAGTPSGHFVVPLPGIAPCPESAPDDQLRAWKAVISDLVRLPPYQKAFFFFNRGVTETDGEAADPDSLVVGRTYSLLVHSFNKHFGRTALEGLHMRAVTDENVVSAMVSPEKTIPLARDLTVTLFPKAVGHSRVELCVFGSADGTARLKMDVKCVQHGDLATAAASGHRLPRADMVRGEKWRVYSAFKRHGTATSEALLAILHESFDPEDSEDQRLNEETIRLYDDLEQWDRIAALADCLSDEGLAQLSEFGRRRALLALCRERRLFPNRKPFLEFPFFEEEHWAAFVQMLRSLEESPAARIALSILPVQRQALIDETNLAELLLDPHISGAINTTSAVCDAGEWLRGNADPATTYEFLVSRLANMKAADESVLRLAFESGMLCGGKDVGAIATQLADCLCGCGQGAEAVEILRRAKDLMPEEDVAHLLKAASVSVRDKMQKLLLTWDTAESYLACGEYALAGVSYRAAMALADELNEDLTLELAQERLEWLEENQGGASLPTVTEAMQLLSDALKGRSVAVMGGDAPLGFLDELGRDLGCILDWFPARKGTPHNRQASLLDAVRSGRYEAVAVLRWAGHDAELKRICGESKVAYVFCHSVGRESLVRRLAQSLGHRPNA